MDKGLNCSVEKYHAKGRCDLCIETDEDRFVFEFKISRDDSGADEKLNEALQQIEDKAYGKILPPKNLYRFAVVFSKDQKARIDCTIISKQIKQSLFQCAEIRT